ncbi:molecular chaperone HtpG [Ruficoccus sp. ZRK36]|uniref:molecular chaperone HtpG n=1 Tax=Ruficoccus sp. ZRK36 TaxID=2866311 RepID=UPI001C72C250|nr:molecular chaperone HtpG [Ruficoccus sp. ZRK36]QYY37164.1 molecular chaperone HtpG [Ruficoccus sp. ZRK36]
MSNQAPETHEFQAEVKQVLDIVVHSLYTDKDIFVRELVSNASDALEKLRHTQLTEKDIYDDNLGLEVNLTTDDAAGTLTIQDFGIGMTREELVENLGTIAHSGSKAFLQAIKENGGMNENLIGQFGVGFYSVFMVAKEVKVFTHTWKKDGEGLCWTSDGSGKYTIEPSEGQRRGTKIVITLQEEYKEFAQNDRVKDILERYSSFIEFPVNLNGEKVNTTQAVWLKNKNDVSEDEYKEFYKFQAKAFDEPMDWMHFSADAPLAVNALIYVPGSNPELLGFGRTEPAVALHCRKILIDPEPPELLPEWLRFLKGVVDSADLPLNISRESMQDSSLVKRLGEVITKRFIKHLGEVSRKDAEKFEKIWRTFGVFIKEGVATDMTHRDKLSELLRFESSETEPGKLTSLQAYVDRMKEDQKAIYFLAGPSRKAIESGPYLEAFKARSLEVIYCLEPIDDFVMQHLRVFKEKELTSADQDELDLGDTTKEAEGEELAKEQLDALCAWLKETLGEDRVKEVSAGKRLVDSPALALNADKMMTSHMRRMMKAMAQARGEDAGADMPTLVNLELNPRHGLIKHLAELKDKDADTAKLVAEQVYDNALISAGMLEDPRAMINRLHQLLEKVGSKA